MKANPLPPTEMLRSALRYEPDTGLLFWRERPASDFDTPLQCRVWNSKVARKKAGLRVKQSYDNQNAAIVVKFNGKSYKAHRLIWAMVHGHLDPCQQIDHKNCDPFDNRLENLRLATMTEQMANRRCLKSQTGYKGVTRNHRGFSAKIRRDGKITYLGTWATPQEAHAGSAGQTWALNGLGWSVGGRWRFTTFAGRF